MNLKEQVGTKVLAHLVGWFQRTAGQHIAMYDSADPRVVRSQIRMAKAVGIDGFVLDWYGPGNELINRVALELAVQCEAEGFEFSVMLDAGIFKWAAAGVDKAGLLYSAVDYALANLATSSAYTRLSGKPLFWEFGLRGNGADMNALFAKYPNLQLLTQTTSIPQSAGTFAWIDTAGGIDALRSYLAAPQSAGIKVPCIFPGFDDHSPANLANSVWGGAARFVSPRNGDTWTDCIQAIKAAGQFQMVQIVTWNDYEEGTAIEPFIKAITGGRTGI